MALKSTTSSSTYANPARAKDSQVEGGTIANAGNIKTTTVNTVGAQSVPGPIKNQIKLDAMRSDTRDETVGAKMVENDGTAGSTTDSVGVAKAYSEGTFAYNATENATHGTTWVMQGGNVTQKLSGVTTDVLRQGANGDGLPEGTERIKINDRLGSNPHASGGMDVLAVPSTEITPGFTKWVTAGDRTTFINPVDGTAAVVSEIKATRAIPGELVYHFGGAGGPQTDDYKAKDAYEQLDGSS